MHRLLCLLPLVIGSRAHALTPAPDDADAWAFNASMTRLEHALDQMQNGTWTLYKQEAIDGVMQPLEVCEVKFARPMSVYIKWTGEVKNGREVLYRKGWNDDNLRVQVSSALPNLNIEPLGALAMRGNRHDVRYVSMPFVTALIGADIQRILADPELMPEVEALEISSIRGEPAECYQTDLPRTRDPAYYADRVELCFSRETDLLLRIEAWERSEGALIQVESYTFSKVKLNTLSAADFDPANPAYDF